MERKVEILAPAGDFLTLRTAVNAGADAVYAGGGKFGARAYAKNFTTEELLAAIDFVHVHGRKLYLTVNTLVKEREFPELYEYLRPFYRQGLDAVIVQDLGVMDFVAQEFPGLAIHASTQMTVTHAISAKYLESLGVERVVPARELSLEEIRRIRRETSLEIECFVHGALCYCYSGQCLLSSMIGGRSGNRGQCAQPCRLPYQIGGRRPADLMSLKDLCTIGMIPELIEAGIDSFKIEGRMKQPEYVAVVTELYRKYADLYLNAGKDSFRVSGADQARLEQAYQRRGYCSGYYHVHNGADMLSLERPRPETQNKQALPAACQEKISGSLVLSPGKRAILYLECRKTRVQIAGVLCEAAQKQPMSRERIEKQLKKTGGTPFAFDSLEIRMEGEVFLPVQALNELRREGLAQLEQALAEEQRRPEPARLSDPAETPVNPERLSAPAEIPADSARRKAGAAAMNAEGPGGMRQGDGGEKSLPCRLTASVETIEQLAEAAAYPFMERIYAEDSLWAEKKNREAIRKLAAQAHSQGKELYFSMARIFRREAERFYGRHLQELTRDFDGALARNQEDILYLRQLYPEFPVIADACAYQWNRRAARRWETLGADALTAPLELNRQELKELDIRGQELVVYGYLPVMVSAGCVKKNTSGCKGSSGFLYLTDRQKNRMRVKNECLYCYNILYNSVPLMLADRSSELLALKPWSLRLQFTSESRDEVRQLLDLYTDACLKGQETGSPRCAFTRGHWKRGVK